ARAQPEARVVPRVRLARERVGERAVRPEGHGLARLESEGRGLEGQLVSVLAYADERALLRGWDDEPSRRAALLVVEAVLARLRGRAEFGGSRVEAVLHARRNDRRVAGHVERERVGVPL